MADANGHPCGDRALGSLASAGETCGDTATQRSKGSLSSFQWQPGQRPSSPRLCCPLSIPLLPSIDHPHLLSTTIFPGLPQSFRLQGQLLSFTNVSNCWHPPREGETAVLLPLVQEAEVWNCAPFVNSVVFPHRAEKHQGSR